MVKLVYDILHSLGGISIATHMACLAPRYIGVPYSFDLGLYSKRGRLYRTLSQVPPVEKAPVLMLRPRAWNMTEHNVLLGEVEKDIIFRT